MQFELFVENFLIISEYDAVLKLKMNEQRILKIFNKSVILSNWYTLQVIRENKSLSTFFPYTAKKIIYHLIL